MQDDVLLRPCAPNAYNYSSGNSIVISPAETYKAQCSKHIFHVFTTISYKLQRWPRYFFILNENIEI